MYTNCRANCCIWKFQCKALSSITVILVLVERKKSKKRFLTFGELREICSLNVKLFLAFLWTSAADRFSLENSNNFVIVNVFSQRIRLVKLWITICQHKEYSVNIFGLKGAYCFLSCACWALLYCLATNYKDFCWWHSALVQYLPAFWKFVKSQRTTAVVKELWLGWNLQKISSSVLSSLTIKWIPSCKLLRWTYKISGVFCRRAIFSLLLRIALILKTTMKSKIS